MEQKMACKIKTIYTSNNPELCIILTSKIEDLSISLKINDR